MLADFAVIETGGKQYKVRKDDVIDIEKVEIPSGNSFVIEKVLMGGTEKDIKVGAPIIEGAKVELEVVDQFRDEKITIFKKKRRKNYRRKTGHRQYLTKVKVKDISF